MNADVVVSAGGAASSQTPATSLIKLARDMEGTEPSHGHYESGNPDANQASLSAIALSKYYSSGTPAMFDWASEMAHEIDANLEWHDPDDGESIRFDVTIGGDSGTIFIAFDVS